MKKTGRKPLSEEETVMLTAKVPRSMREWFVELGGSAWLRDAITKAWKRKGKK